MDNSSDHGTIYSLDSLTQNLKLFRPLQLPMVIMNQTELQALLFYLCLLQRRVLVFFRWELFPRVPVDDIDPSYSAQCESIFTASNHSSTPDSSLSASMSRSISASRLLIMIFIAGFVILANSWNRNFGWESVSSSFKSYFISIWANVTLSSLLAKKRPGQACFP